jgi:hypothetical protein
MEEADGRGAAGEAGKAGGGAGKKGGRRPEEGDGPDRWAPPVGGCERERREAGALVGRVGRKRVWAAAEKKKGGER